MDRGAKKFATLLQQEAPKLPENTPKYRKQRGSFLPEKGKEKKERRDSGAAGAGRPAADCGAVVCVLHDASGGKSADFAAVGGTFVYAADRSYTDPHAVADGRDAAFGHAKSVAQPEAH